MARSQQRRSGSRSRPASGSRAASRSQSRSESGSRRQASGTGRSRSRSQGTTSRSRTARLTTDHNEIRQWVESHGGNPSRVIGTGTENPTLDPGLLRIDFPGFSGEGSLEPLDWEEFFDQFESRRLAFLYQAFEVEGEEGPNRFCKLVSREQKEESPLRSSRSRQGSRGGSGGRSRRRSKE